MTKRVSGWVVFGDQAARTSLKLCQSGAFQSWISGPALKNCQSVVSKVLEDQSAGVLELPIGLRDTPILQPSLEHVPSVPAV